MYLYMIYIGEFPQTEVSAWDEWQAIDKWLANNGYDSNEEAAREYDLEGTDLKAVFVG